MASDRSVLLIIVIYSDDTTMPGDYGCAIDPFLLVNLPLVAAVIFGLSITDDPSPRTLVNSKLFPMFNSCLR